MASRRRITSPRSMAITNVAVLEKGWLGGGNTGRNTTIVRSNYHLDPNAHFYEFSLKLWEGLSRELNFNVMYSARGVLNLVHSPADMDASIRRGNAMRLNGIDAEFMSRDQIARWIPNLDCSPVPAFRFSAACCSGAAARSAMTRWRGAMRAGRTRSVSTSSRNARSTGIRVDHGAISGVETTLRLHRDATSSASPWPDTPATSPRWRARVCPSNRTCCRRWSRSRSSRCSIPVVTSGAVHFYISQSDKGELVMGGDLDFYNSYAQRGNLPTIEHVVAACLALFPSFGRLKLMRTWGGIMDMTMDGSPIIAKLPVKGLTMSGGWCYGGFKATPASGWLHAYTIARDEPHPLNAAFTLERFRRGAG